MTFKKVFGLLLILIILAAGGIYLLMIEKADDDRMRSLYTEVEPLEREREALIEEKNNLDTEYATKMLTNKARFRSLAEEEPGEEGGEGSGE